MEEREQEALRELGAARVGEIHCITIIGQVEGHVMLPPDTKTTKYEHIMPLLAAVEEAEDIRALLILLNTVGGDIEAGLCLAERRRDDPPGAAHRCCDRRAADVRLHFAHQR